ncbi:hypothetical protein [Nocardioides soli]|uniref:Uncharacterized protein n=1 Tax=Nocardioides soli TaxID=1036020 RepID=A0A7W4VT09_9ACTN|nr:hypothetical protein [Nocardioides soli]MBB3041213.1 hypothetical protein [Nocardioides soli]
MGYDDGECTSPTGAHNFVLAELAPGGRGGLAMVEKCEWCDATAYMPSAGDDPRRPPL